MNKKALAYSGALLITLVVVSVILRIGLVQAVRDVAESTLTVQNADPFSIPINDGVQLRAELSYQIEEATTLSDLVLRIHRDGDDSTHYAISNSLTVAGFVTEVANGATSGVATLPSGFGPAQRVGEGESCECQELLAAGNLIVAWELVGVVNFPGLPAGTLPGSGGGFKGIDAGAKIVFDVLWEVPIAFPDSEGRNWEADYTANIEVAIVYSLPDVERQDDTLFPPAVQFRVVQFNTPPIAVPDGAAEGAVTDQDNPTNPIDVLFNDTDLENDPLSIDSFDATSTTGSVILNLDDTFTYDPDGNFNNLAVGDQAFDTFEYTVTDGKGGFASTTVTVTINGLNDAPNAVSDEGATDEDTQTTINVLGNDTDADDDDVLEIVLPTEISGFSDGGATTTRNIDGVSIDYDPSGAFDRLSEGQEFVDTFTYTIEDLNGLRSTTSVEVTLTGVNDAPVAEPDFDAVSVEQFGVGILIQVLDNDTDAEDDFNGVALTIDATEINDVADFGIVEVFLNVLVQYTLDDVPAILPAVDTFDYAITDSDGVQVFGTVSIAISAQVNVPPIANDDPDVVTNEDTSVNIFVLANDNDPDGFPQLLTISAVDQPTNGTTTIIGNFITYDPDPDFNSLVPDQFEYEITDGLDIATATVSVLVNSVNDDPVAVDDEATTDEDTPVNIFVRLNDSDVDGDIPTISTTTDPAFGTAVVVGGAFIQYTPDQDFNGNDSFTYTIDDGNGGFATANVDVTVDPVNDAPTVEQLIDDLTVDEDSADFSDSLNDTFDDVDGDVLALSATSSNPD